VFNKANIRANSRQSVANSQTIIDIVNDLATIDVGVPHVEISSASYAQTFDIFVSEDNNLRVTSSAPAGVTIDGQGHALRFARGKSNVFTIAASKNVLLTNVILKDFSDDAVQLGSGSSLKFGDGAVVELAASESLSRNWTFQGTSKVVGLGNNLTLGLYDIQVLQPGTLTLQDVSITDVCNKGSSEKNLKCVGNNASIVLKDSSLSLSRNYTFTSGSITFNGDVLVTGTNKFTYASTQASTISSNASLMLDTGITFSYAAATSSSRDLITMTDITSKLFINGCSLCSTTTGLRLTNGTLVIDHRNSIYSEAVSLSQAMSIGNGTSANDLNVVLMPGGMLDVATGILSYENAS
jgi:hypothetical protein